MKTTFLSGLAAFMETKEKIDFCFDVIKRHDHYIATTNVKVTLLISFLTLVISGISIKIIEIPPPQNLSSIYYMVIMLGLLTILFSLTALANLIRVVFPRLDTKKTEDSLIFFGDISKIEQSGKTYSDLITSSDENKILIDISQQIEIVSKITSDKFRTLSLAITIIIWLVFPLLLLSITFLTIYNSV